MSRSPFAFALLALLAAAPASASRVEPGEWEQTMEVEAPESGHGAMKRTGRACITKQDAEVFSDRERWASEMARANEQCKLKESKEDGSAITAVLSCEGDVTVTVRQDFSGTSGTIDAQTTVGGVVQGKNRITSKRVADTCSPETIEQWKAANPGKTFAP